MEIALKLCVSAQDSIICCECSRPICDEFILQVQGQMFHSRCLNCHVCKASLEYTCYRVNSHFYCQGDFFRLFGTKCSACDGSIDPTEAVRRAHDNIYHVHCFRCHQCRGELCTGDEFYLSLDAHLYCKADYMALKSQEQGQDLPSDVLEANETLDKLLSNPEHLLKECYRQGESPPNDVVEKIAHDMGVSPPDLRLWFKQQKSKQNRGSYSENSEDGNLTIRVNSPIGGYPLPIVNPALSPEKPSGHLPASVHQFINQLLTNNPLPPQTCDIKAWGELWSNDFIPPNVNLQPDHINDGEVVHELYHQQ